MDTPSDKQNGENDVRNHIVDMAVSFLRNPKVVGSPLEQKKAFLVKKGLTPTEIDLAVSKANDNSAVQQQLPNQIETIPPYPGAMNPHAQQIFQGPIVPYSRWQLLRDVVSTVSLLAGLSYAAYLFYKKYIVPYLFGVKKEKNKLDVLEDQIQQLSLKVESVSSKITMMNEQSRQYATYGPQAVSLEDVRADLNTIKGLFLGRQQFPEVPKSTRPVLPSWQLQYKTSDDEGKKEDQHNHADAKLKPQNVGVSNSKANDSDSSVNSAEDKDKADDSTKESVAPSNEDVDNSQEQVEV